ncbi:hypothetical protein BH23PLA1_BH23PLA1_13500 [soil metagenome]
MAKKTSSPSKGKSASGAKSGTARAARTTRTKPETKSKPETTELAVRVRMYCQGLGDCFLLTFPPGPGSTRPLRVMIDCGVFQFSPGEANKLGQVTRSIRDETDGKIDLLIITHEHWDHISGFAHCQEIFDDFEFKRIWMSWAENLDDPDSKQVKTELGKKQARLRAAVKQALLRLDSSLEANSGNPFTARLRDDMISAESVLEFFGPEEDDAGGLALAGDGGRTARGTAGKRRTLDDTMNWLRERVKPGDFCSPGECRPLPGASGVKVYVLGPPRSVKSIRKVNPSRGQTFGHLTERVSLLGALDWMASNEGADPPGPFDDRHRLSPEDARLDPFFREIYGFPDDPLGDEGPIWRRIDDEWLGGIGHLALQLDTGVNNTSLALAFELPDGRTLIFPGDAQVGNWLSWAEVTFKDGTGRELFVTVQQLLNRAVLYKVGHHGSHNATLKPGGLEEMTSAELVAMIPTDEAFAKTKRPPADGWKMPSFELYEALTTFTHHRILRADQGATDLDAEVGNDAASPRWKEFRGRVTFAEETFTADPKDLGPPKPLYVEYTIPFEVIR